LGDWGDAWKEGIVTFGDVCRDNAESQEWRLFEDLFSLVFKLSKRGYRFVD
jgi:hypothetical protein